jgi:hypothetical protein
VTYHEDLSPLVACQGFIFLFILLCYINKLKVDSNPLHRTGTFASEVETQYTAAQVKLGCAKQSYNNICKLDAQDMSPVSFVHLYFFMRKECLSLDQTYHSIQIQKEPR